MSMNTQAYWADVKSETERLRALRKTQPWQPQDDENSIFLTSINHRPSGTKAGFVVLCPLVMNGTSGGDRQIYVAGKLIVDGTHRESTEQEVSDWQTLHANRRAEMGVAMRRETGTVRIEAPSYSNTDPNAKSELQILKDRIAELEAKAEAAK